MRLSICVLVMIFAAVTVAGQKKMIEALADYSKTIEIFPLADAFYSRGVANEESGHTDLALADYTRAIELNPKLARAVANRGIILLQRGEDVEAQRDFDAAFQLDSNLRAELGEFIKKTREARQATKTRQLRQ